MNIGQRIIPILLLEGEGLVKTMKFQKRNYLGDPINTFKIFNDKEVDEIVLLDIDAHKRKREINYSLIKEIAGECFMPLCYGGGIKCADDVAKILKCGVEKVSVNSQAIINPKLIEDIAKKHGSSTLVVSIDYGMTFFKKHKVFIYGGRKKTQYSPESATRIIEEMGAGELLLQCIDRDGMFSGYDYEMLQKILNTVKIPVILCSGAQRIEECEKVNSMGASAAAGSLFVYKGKHNAKLINYTVNK